MSHRLTIFPHIRPVDIIFSLSSQLQVLLEIAEFTLYKIMPGAGIIRNAGIIRGRAIDEKIRYFSSVHCRAAPDSL